MKNFNSYEREELLKGICDVREENFEQKWLMTKYSLISYLKSLFTYGFKSEITKDNLNVMKEVKQIIKAENSILEYLIDNITEVNIESAWDYLDKLDILNAKTIFYYIHVIEDIEESCEMKEPLRAKRSPRDFKTFTDSAKYQMEAIALTKDEKQIREYLGYEDEFWKYIDSVIKRVDATTTILNEITYAIPIHDSDDKICGISILVPKIVDYDSAVIAIELYKKAYDIYKSFGNNDVKSDEKGISLVKKFNDDLESNASKIFGR